MRVAHLSALVVLASSTLALGACSVDDAAESDNVSSTNYADLYDRLSDADLTRWITAKNQLVDDFDQVCGDTFCGSDYSNLTNVSLHCSATAAGTVNSCSWTFGGSIEYVDGLTGAISIDTRTFTCPIKVHTKVGPFLTALESGEGSSSIHRVIPGTGKSFYDGLGECFSGVVGDAPPATTGTKYEELADYFNEHGGPAGTDWYQERQALVGGFDQACGDSFCEGDYADISGLRFVCAVNTTTHKLKNCSWSFVGDYTTVAKSSGKVTDHTQEWRCDVPVTATAAAFATALNVPDPLHATIPGKTTSIYDALVGCL